MNLTENIGNIENAENFELYYQQNYERILKELRAAVRFQSVSSEPRFHGQVEACGEWYIEHLEEMGFTAQFLKTNSLPLVYAERPGRRSLPTVLLYGHIDVQPSGDPDLWTTPPFEPQIRDGRLYARGSRDNKGQTFFWLKALEMLSEMGLLHNTIKILLDTEEESGSPGLLANIYHYSERLESDLLVASETPGCSNGDPAIIVGLRGTVYMRIRLVGASKELHSGNHGGIVRNPLIELSKILSSLTEDSGKIRIPSFYDNVIEPSKLERDLASKLPFNADIFSKEFGVKEIIGENGFSPIEQIGFRPSLDIMGLSGGARGSQIKTSIPTHADAAICMRLVPGQDPEEIIKQTLDYIKSQLPKGMLLDVLHSQVLADSFRSDLKSPYYDLVNKALDGVISHDVYYSWGGASLPMIPKIKEITKATPVLIGFGLDADNEHGIDESFSLEQFKKGFMFASKFLSLLSEKKN